MKKAIQFGAGNIGRGFIGGLLSKAGYHVVFADVNQKIIDKINEDKKYTKITIQPYITDNINPKMYELQRSLNFTCNISFDPHVACEMKKGLKMKYLMALK